MRPSIMSDGAMTSQPASTCTSAWRHSASTVSSLTTWPSRTMPSWPSALNGSSATSQTTPISGWASLMVRMAWQTRLSGFQASSACGVFRLGSITGNIATAGMPSALASPTASGSRSTV